MSTAINSEPDTTGIIRSIRTSVEQLSLVPLNHPNGLLAVGGLDHGDSLQLQHPTQ